MSAPTGVTRLSETDTTGPSAANPPCGLLTISVAHPSAQQLRPALSARHSGLGENPCRNTWSKDRWPDGSSGSSRRRVARRSATINEVQLEVAQILDRGGIGR